MRNPLLAGRLFGVPLLAHPEKAAIVADVFLARAGIEAGGLVISRDLVGDAFGPERAGLEADVIGGALDRRAIDPFPIVDGIAIIAVDGTTVNRGDMMDAASGMVSYQTIQAKVQRAMRSDAVRAVALDVDSFGGEVQGVFETAGMIRDLAVAKPTMAIVGANCCSAAYLLASQARRIVAPEDGLVGSIGAVIMHVDKSRLFANAGVKVTFIHAGTRKVEGNEFEPLPEDVVARLQGRVDETRQRFAAVVAAARPGVTADAALATEAACFYGPEALRLGLIDAVAEPSAAFAAFRAALNGA